jgi:hypothetical protein
MAQKWKGQKLENRIFTECEHKHAVLISKCPQRYLKKFEWQDFFPVVEFCTGLAGKFSQVFATLHNMVGWAIMGCLHKFHTETGCEHL